MQAGALRTPPCEAREPRLNGRFRGGSRRPLHDLPIEPRKPRLKTGGRTMTFRTLLIAGAALLSLGAASVPAYAGGSTIHIEQYGFGNEFGGGQHDHRNRITLYQNGYGNSAISNQTGAYNTAEVTQVGHGNVSVIVHD